MERRRSDTFSRIVGVWLSASRSGGASLLRRPQSRNRREDCPRDPRHRRHLRPRDSCSLRNRQVRHELGCAVAGRQDRLPAIEDAIAHLRRLRRDAQLRACQESGLVLLLRQPDGAHHLPKTPGTTRCSGPSACTRSIPSGAGPRRRETSCSTFPPRPSGSASANCAATCSPPSPVITRFQSRWSIKWEATTVWFSMVPAWCSIQKAKLSRRGNRSKKILSTLIRRRWLDDLHEQIEGRGSERIRGAGPRNPRLHAQVRIPKSHHRPERWHRFGAHCRDCSRRRRAGKCDRRRHARPLLFAGIDRRRPRPGKESWHPLRVAIHQSGLRIVPANPAGRLRGSEGRRHGREYSVARPRHDADGALEQVRRHRALDRQQERAGRGLLHALRRHGRRARGDFRRSENAGLPR